MGALTRSAEFKISQNKKAEALPLYHEITTLMREKYGDDSRSAAAMEREAELMKEMGQEQAARDLQTEASDIRKKAFSK